VSSSTSVVPSDDSSIGSIAPWWHTVLVLLPIAVASIASAYQQGLPNLNLPGLNHRLSGYVTVIILEWIIVLVVWLGIRHRVISIGSLVGGSWSTPRAFFRDLGFGIGLIIIVVPVVNGVIHLLGNTARIQGTLVAVTPKTLLELFVWLVLNASAAFGEELVFRGYLMRQFSAWTGSRAFGLVLQGVAFGFAHGYYGKAMLGIMIHGWLLGLLAWWRKSLRPGMLAHGVQDALGGIVAFLMLR